MSAQIIELIFLAFVALLVIGKLISILGSDEGGGRSYFGESGSIKDVTASAKKISLPFIKQKKENPLASVIAPGVDISSIENSLDQILSKNPSFIDPYKFVSNAKKAFALIIESYGSEKEEDLKALLDPRFLEPFKEKAHIYGKISDPSKLEAKISDIYTFGNVVFVKISFKGKNLSPSLKNLKEEWVFTRNITNEGRDWYLSNIDRDV